MSSKAIEISSIIKEQIRQYESKIEMKENGTVITVGDGIATVYGLRACMANELLRFEDGSFGVAQNLEEETVSVAILSERDTVREGSVVYRTGEALSVTVGETMLGRVVAFPWTARGLWKRPRSVPLNPPRRASSSARASACRCRPVLKLSTV